MTTFYFLLVLMTVKGTECEFTLDWLKNVNKNEKFRNAFYLFIFQATLLVIQGHANKRTDPVSLAKSMLTFM